MAYIIPILASNSIGIIFFIMAIVSDYIKSKKIDKMKDRD